MAVEQILFSVHGLKLSGVLHLPAGKPLCAIIGSHGLMADKSSPKQIELARQCTSIGMAYFRFDHRGCGESEGDFEKDTTLDNRCADLLAAAEAVGNALGKTLPMGLFGSSFGGTVCLMASRGVSPFSVVTLAAPVRSCAIKVPSDSPNSLKNEISGRGLDFDIGEHIQSIRHILVVHGSHDEIVCVDNAQMIYRHASEPKKKLILKDADHRISKKTHQKVFIQNTVQWFSECYENYLSSR
jgi:alpha-beta hydrolase superfamily lysophospholipase